MSTSESNSPDVAGNRALAVKVVGVGDAGCRVVEGLAREGLGGAALYAVNTDAQSLARCPSVERVQIGGGLTRGLGAGGDPELGRVVGQESAGLFEEICAGADLVFLITGLGGGTGTGASPLLARAAREKGALVVAFAALPFEFEGGRRSEQASIGLERLRAGADAVLCLPNERVLRTLDERASVMEAFESSNRTIALGVGAVWRLAARPGLLNLGFADLCSVVRGRRAESSFATVVAEGEARVQELVANLFAHPLMAGGAVLEEAGAVLVSLVGGPELSVADIGAVVSQIEARSGSAQVMVGAAAEAGFAGRLSLTVIATRRGAPVEGPEETGASAGAGQAAGESAVPGELPMDTGPVAEGAGRKGGSRFVPPAPQLSEDRKAELLAQQGGRKVRRGRSRMRQGTLPLEIVSKGRFEKSEPTIHQGEDLDVPTYIRRGVSLN